MTLVRPARWGGRASAGQVIVNVYSATQPGDPRVTEGTNSIAVKFLADGFGNDLGVTRERVRQLETRALRELRAVAPALQLYLRS